MIKVYAIPDSHRRHRLGQHPGQHRKHNNPSRNNHHHHYHYGLGDSCCVLVRNHNSASLKTIEPHRRFSYDGAAFLSGPVHFPPLLSGPFPSVPIRSGPPKYDTFRPVFSL